MNQLTQAPAHLAGNRRQVAAQSVAGMGQKPTPYISIEGGRFTLVDAEGNEFPWTSFGQLPVTTDQGVPQQGVYIDAVVVDVNEKMSKAYYTQAWSPNAQKYLPPICWSDNGLAPSVSATQPQNGTCEHCPWNKWGSKINQLKNEVKACDDLKKIAWYVPELQRNMVFLMRLKGSSHRNWRDYVDRVRKHDAGGRPADPVDVVTRIYFEPGSTGILDFEMVGFIDQVTAAAQEQVWADKSTDQMVGRLDMPRTAAIAPPAPAAQIAHQPPVDTSQGFVAQPQQVHQPVQQAQPVDDPIEAEIRRLQALQASKTGQAAVNPSLQAQTQPVTTQRAPVTAPAGFGGAAPLPAGQGSAATGGFGQTSGGHAGAPNTAQGNAGAADGLPPSGRAPRKPRAPRQAAAQQQPVNQPPQTFAQPTAPQPQPPNHQAATTAQPPQNFGITQGAPINADLDAALNNAIGGARQ